jgi:fatty acid-binding protein DegV
MLSVGKCKGKMNTLRRLVQYVEELGEDIDNHRIIIGHADALEIAQTLANLLEENIGRKLPIEYVVVNPTAGSHCGPDTIGVCFHAKCR